MSNPNDRQVLIAVMQELQNISANFIMLNKKSKDLQTQVKEFYEQQSKTEPYDRFCYS